MNRSTRRNLIFVSALAAGIALMIVFPRVGAFAELAAREIRLLWWLFVIAAAGIYFSFFFGRRRD
ncbi:MAG TPA: hypothetical protein VFT72_01985 [Opitutaceae bacterium]|nr:hypothetical protein [Opitutaceae bacterium]